MAVTLMTTTGSLQDVQAALGIPAGSAPPSGTETGPIVASAESLPVAPPAETVPPEPEPTAETPDTPPVETAPPDATPPAADGEAPDSEFDEDGEPLTERAARSSRTKLQTIKKLRVRARTAELELARTQGELAAFKAGKAPAPLEPPAPPVLTPTNDQEPQEADYATYEAYIEARADFRARRAVREELDQRQQHDEAVRVQRTVAERIAAFAAEHPDYQEVVSNPDLVLTPAIADTLTASEDGPALAYALAKDVPRFQRIRALPPVLAIRAIGELAAELRLAQPAPKAAEPPPTPKLPSAPPPPTPVRGGSVATSVTLEEFAKSIQPGDAKTSEWIRRRNEQVARQGQR